MAWSPETVTIPFCQGDVLACSHICVAFAARVIRKGADLLAPPLLINHDAVQKFGDIALESYARALELRAREHPTDKSKFFTPARVVYAMECSLKPADVFWTRREDSGYLMVRGEVGPGVRDAGGHMRALVDEVEFTWKETRRTGKYHAMIITDSSEYTRLAIFCPHGAWFYDSHGRSGSLLCWFGDNIEELLVYMLRKSGAGSAEEERTARAQWHDPALRTSVNFDATLDALYRRYEVLVMTAK